MVTLNSILIMYVGRDEIIYLFCNQVIRHDRKVYFLGLRVTVPTCVSAIG